MTTTVKLELSPEALSLESALSRFPDEVKQSIKRGLTEALAEVTKRIKSNRLSGKGPFPVEEHRLGVVSGLLRGTTDSTPAIAISEGDHVTVTGSIGTEVPYAVYHEFGYDGEQTVKSHLRASKRGKVYRVKEFTRHVNLPARAPFHTGVEENLDYIAQKIEDSLQETLSAR